MKDFDTKFSFEKFITLSLYMTCLVFTVSAQNWTPQQSNADKPLYEIFFVDETTGWALGESSEGPVDYIRSTTDQGQNWIPGSIEDNDLDIRSAYFFNHFSGIAVGIHSSGSEEGFVALTNDGGNSWLINTQSFEEQLMDIHFVSLDEGWIVGENGYIAVSADGGQSWLKISSESDRDLNGVFFTDDQNGIVVGDNGTLLKTNNGGITWLEISSGTKDDLLSITFSNPMNGWATGDNGAVINTQDGGLNWTSQNSGTSRRLFDVDAVNNQMIWSVGQNGKVIRTADGGINWFNEESGTDRDILAIDMIHESLGWFSGDHGVIHIYDPTITSTAGNNQIPSEINIYPNPVISNGLLNVYTGTNDNYAIEVLDTQGQVVHDAQKRSSNVLTLSLPSLFEGVYFLKVINLDNANYQTIRIRIN